MTKLLSPEERHELIYSTVTTAGYRLLEEEIDIIINRIRDGIHGCSLSNDPNADGLKLLKERHKLEGALALKHALAVEVQKIKAKGE